MASRKGKGPHGSLIFLILILSLLLNTLMVWRAGYSNLYYSAAVYSMSKDWGNFFFASFDPLGFISVDKPPLGLMIQALFVRIMGFNTWAIHLPQIIAATLSCFVLYKIIANAIGKAAGKWAGLLGAFCLAVTPIFVATARNNTMDSILILFLLLGCWAAMAASGKGSMGLLTLSAICVGLAFNVKMSQALLALPGMVLVYMISPKLGIKARLIHLVSALVITVTISIAWMSVVALTPADERPFVGSTEGNSAFELAVGHNGMARLSDNDDMGQQPRANKPKHSNKRDITAPFRRQGAMETVNQMVDREGGGTGFLRLLRSAWYGQSSWLLVLAVLSLVSTIVVTTRYGEEPLGRAAVLFTTWLLCGWGIFSFSNGIIHTYYLCMMAPPIAGCVALGAYAMIKLYREDAILWVLLPITLIVVAMEQAAALTVMEDWSGLAIAPLGCGGVGIVLALARLYPDKDKGFYRTCTAIAVSGIMLLNVGAVAWSITPILYGDANPLPMAGPSLMEEKRPYGEIPDGMVTFLEQGSRGCEILAITPTADSYGAALIVTTGKPVIAAGGFSGADRYISTEKLKGMVESKQVRYMILEGDMRQPFMGWVSSKRKIDPAQWYKGEPVAHLPQIVDLWYQEATEAS